LFPFKKVYIRQAYKELYERVMKGPNFLYIVVGDPGTGKTSFMRYFFMQLCSSNEKVFMAMESGAWIYGNGQRYEEGYDARKQVSIWRNPTVFLLIDGVGHEEYLVKSKRVIVFSSPQKNNYHKLKKENDGIFLFMPPWEWKEVNQLCSDLMEDSDLVSEYKTRFENADHEQELMIESENPSDSQEMRKAEEGANESESKGGVDQPLDYGVRKQPFGYDDFEESKKLSGYDDFEEWRKFKQANMGIKEFLKGWFEKKYFLVGGRIRLIVQKRPILELREEILRGLSGLTSQQLEDAGNFFAQAEVPSILYTIRRGATYETTPKVEFASFPIAQWAVSALVRNEKQEILNTIKQLQHSDVAGAFIGRLFERYGLRTLAKGGKFQMKKLNSSTNENQESDEETLTLDAVEWERIDMSKKFDTDSRALGIPLSRTQAQVDAIHFDKKMLFQFTISNNHSFIQSHIEKVLENANWQPSKVKFVFVVPIRRYHTFGYQHPKTTRRGKRKHIPKAKLIPQYVLSWPDSDKFESLEVFEQLLQ
jgi:hypothetical protein